MNELYLYEFETRPYFHNTLTYFCVSVVLYCIRTSTHLHMLSITQCNLNFDGQLSTYHIIASTKSYIHLLSLLYLSLD